MERRLVKNTEGSTDESRSWAEYYYKHKMPWSLLGMPARAKCPSCGKIMVPQWRIQQRSPHNDQKPYYTNKDMIVGAHVADCITKETFILPLCKECNDAKGKLPPFFAPAKDLLPSPTD